MVMDKKSKSSLTKFLHDGEVRDFRIQSKNLRDAIDQEVMSQAVEVNEDNLEDEIPDLDEVETRDSQSSRSRNSGSRGPNLSESDSEDDRSTPESSIHEVPQKLYSMEQFKENVAALGKRGPKISVANTKNKQALAKKRKK